MGMVGSAPAQFEPRSVPTAAKLDSTGSTSVEVRPIVFGPPRVAEERFHDDGMVRQVQVRIRAAERHGLPVAPLFPRFHNGPNPCPPVESITPNTPPATNPVPALPSQEEIARNVPNPQNTFASPTEGGGTAARSFNDNFNGDFGGIAVRVRRPTGTVTTSQSVTQNRQETGVSGPFGPITTETIAGPTTNSTSFQDFFVSAGARYGGILITENDSPRPTTRFYLGANYYGGINASLNGMSGGNVSVSGGSQALPDSTDSSGGTNYVLTNRVSTSTIAAQSSVPNLANSALVRQTIGFEYAFWNDSASVGMRLPFQQNLAPAGLGGNYLGDLSILLKYAFYENRRTGDLMSVGLVVSTPVGNDPQIVLADGSQLPVSVIYQPWFGGIRTFERGYFQAISSVLMPSNAVEPTLLNNSFAASYFLYQNEAAKFLKLVAPAFEVHVRTPLNNRDPNGLIYVQDQVNVTSSVHFRTERVTVSPAFAVPLVGPKPWSYEGILWVNVKF